MKKTYCLFTAFIAICVLVGCSKGSDQPKSPDNQYYSATTNEVQAEPPSAPGCTVIASDVSPLYFADSGFYGQVRLIAESEDGVEQDTFNYPCFVRYSDGNLKIMESYLVSSNIERQFINNILFIGPHGGYLVLVDEVTEYWWDAPEGMNSDNEQYNNYYQYKDCLYLRVINSNGQLIEQAELDAAVSTDLQWENAYLDESEKLNIPSGDSIKVFGLDGQLQSTTTYEPKEAQGLPENIMTVDSNCGEYNIFYIYNNKLFGTNGGEKEAVLLVDWSIYGIDANTARAITVLDDGTIVCVYSSMDTNGNEIAKIIKLEKTEKSIQTQIGKNNTDTRDEIDPNTGKIVLSLGTADPESIRMSVEQFNSSDPDYIIKIVSYAGMETQDIAVQIGSGKMPDILDVGRLPLRQMSANGLVEDLYPFIDDDPELNREDYMGNILDAFTYDGKLACTVANFECVTVVSPSILVGTEPGMTYDELNSIVNSMPDDMTLFHPLKNRDAIFTLTLPYELDSYIDWPTLSCKFDSIGFIQYLEFLRSIPETVGESSTATRPLCLLRPTSIAAFDDYDGVVRYAGTDKFTFIGYPCAYGTGNAFHPRGDFSMSSSCKHKDAAWRFIRQYMTSAYQQNQKAFPSNRNLLDARREAAISNGTVTREQAEQIMALINSTTKTDTQNYALYNMILEQAQPYFRGEKTAEEAAAQIQSRVGLFLGEMQ